MKAIHRATIKGGRIIFKNEARFAVAKSALEGQDVDVTLEKHRSARSTGQNRYYHGVVVQVISNHTGYTTEETHEILKQLFFSHEVTVGKKTVTIATTTKENTKEWEDKMGAIRSWASCELKCFIPEPNEVSL